MFENLRGNASCFDVCPIGHQCLGGYLNEELLCDAEILRIREKLQETSGIRDIIFSPTNNVGLKFIFTLAAERHSLVLSDGIIK